MAIWHWDYKDCFLSFECGHTRPTSSLCYSKTKRDSFILLWRYNLACLKIQTGYISLRTYYEERNCAIRNCNYFLHRKIVQNASAEREEITEISTTWSMILANSSLMYLTISIMSNLDGSLKCLRTYIFPTAARRPSSTKLTHVFQRSLFAVLPVMFLSYSSSRDLKKHIHTFFYKLLKYPTMCLAFGTTISTFSSLKAPYGGDGLIEESQCIISYVVVFLDFELLT